MSLIKSLVILLIAVGFFSPSLRAEEVSYTVALDVASLIPLDCGGVRAASTALPIELGDFKDRQPDRRVAQLEKSGEFSPVYLDRSVGETLKEGIALTLQRCGYRVVGASTKDKDQSKVVMTGDVESFQVEWEKKLLTAKGSGQLKASLALSTPTGGHYSFSFQVQSDEKGMRKKGISQIEQQLQAAYREFLIQFSRYGDFHQTMGKVSQQAKDGVYHGGSSYPVDDE